MGFHNIEKKNFWYILLKKLIVDPWHNLIFYRKIRIYNKERIPKEGHLIFTPNHQNALLDALALLCNIDRQLIFLARSDIFKKKKISKILYFIKILPLFRIRDGYSEVKKNTETFDKTIEVIKSGNGLVILPEGDYVRKQQLRPLKKGFARIAFQTEEANNFSLDLKIIPVGLHYNDYDEQRGDLMINFGHPIPLAQFSEIYKESPAVAINQITKKLTESLKPLILNLPDDDYTFFKNLAQIYVSGLKQLNKYDSHDLQYENEFVDSLKKLKEEQPEEYKDIKLVYNNFNTQLQEVGIENQNRFFTRQNWQFFVLNIFQLILGFPFFVYGLANNLLPFSLTNYFVNKIKDPGFKSSFRFAISLLVFPMFYILQMLILFISFKIWWLVLIYFVTLPISWIFSVWYAKLSRNTVCMVQRIRIMVFNQKKYKELNKMYKVLSEKAININQI